MNHETTIKRIQELVPDVMALEFGCEVLYGSDFGGAEQKVTLGNPYAVKDGKVFNPWNGDDTDDLLEILGKPITLSVILLAIDDESLVIKAKTGQFGTTTREGVFVGGLPRWNLSKDNFNDQSEETKTFIGGLLGN